MSRSLVEVDLKWPISLPDLDTKVLKKGFRGIGREVVKMARKNISRRNIVSKAGEFPGLHTGALRKTVTNRLSRTGKSVAVRSYPKTGDEPIPFYVLYGHRPPKADMSLDGRKDSRQAHKTRSGQKVAVRRKDWIIEAADEYGRAKYRTVMSHIIDEAIKPGVITG